jgi:glycosyltransferase involved in cell wall biosynthesis
VTTVDVVIPTYRETWRLFRAINSAKKQTYPVSTIWVIDDGSEKPVVDEIEKYFLADKQVVFKSVPHTGLPGKLREIAINDSAADWIAFLDADDYWVDKKLEKQLSLAQLMQSELVYSNATKITDSEMDLYFLDNQFCPSATFYDLVSDNKIINSTVLVRRDNLLEIGTYCSTANVRSVEDYATWLRLSTKIKFAGSPEPLIFYQVSPKGLSQENTPNRRVFALADFLTWSKELPVKGLAKRLKTVWKRAYVVLQLIRESLI